MKIKYVLVYASIITCICLCYVHLQVEVITIGYKLRNKEKKLSELIDGNRVLLYNNASLKSPQYLAGMLKQNKMDLSLPDTASVAQVRVVRKNNFKLAKSSKVSGETNFVDVFIPKAEAAADIKR